MKYLGERGIKTLSRTDGSSLCRNCKYSWLKKVPEYENIFRIIQCCKYIYTKHIRKRTRTKNSKRSHAIRSFKIVNMWTRAYFSVPHWKPLANDANQQETVKLILYTHHFHLVHLYLSHQFQVNRVELSSSFQCWE